MTSQDDFHPLLRAFVAKAQAVARATVVSDLLVADLRGAGNAWERAGYPLYTAAKGSEWTSKEGVGVKVLNVTADRKVIYFVLGEPEDWKVLSEDEFLGHFG